MDWHTKISFIKSAIRIVAGLCLVLSYFALAGSAFVIAEVLGVIEEL